VEIHEIESAIILAEAEAKAKRDLHRSIADRRDTLKKSVSEIRDKYAEMIYEIEKRMREEIRELSEQRGAETQVAEEEYHLLANDQWEAQRAASKAEQALNDLQRMLDQAKRATLKSQEFATLENRWDLMTMGAPWREWAKDHQIGGAKKITYEGRMILGDTMGLGKTLTSLIAIDMIEAATKEASPENPVKFGSMD
jgi:SNF2 family DNA or RNA helicase